ncbi:hypothetical protein PVAP13_7KG104918 [Panicum virgatum]|uniref:Uncharacterized protein n=1 Tax=Panicum virgatum TaxID=38727 RepID=A0A8T0QJF1_PANVG|nr:hypothetical protein PVAP13_7KG104918 [Panicum virgatum]
MEQAREANREALKKEFMSLMQAAQGQPSLQHANNDRQQIAEVAPATIMGDGNETTTESNLDSSPLQTKLACTAPAGINTTRTTRSSVANNKQIGQYKGGNTTILYTTAKALKDNAAKKRAVSKRNQQSSSAHMFPNEINVVDNLIAKAFFSSIKLQVSIFVNPSCKTKMQFEWSARLKG